MHVADGGAVVVAALAPLSACARVIGRRRSHGRGRDASTVRWVAGWRSPIDGERDEGAPCATCTRARARASRGEARVDDVPRTYRRTDVRLHAS